MQAASPACYHPAVSPTGGAPPAAAVATLPADRDALLESAPPERQKLYRLVRRVLDELDEAAPWDQLYYPPDDSEAFLGMAAGLLGVVEQIPGRTRELVDALSLAAPDDETRGTLEEAEFYFAGIHRMCAHDLFRLRTQLDPYTSPAAPALRPAERNFLCEVAADLKGKYASALMGATASIVAEGSWSGVEVEPVLFPEKSEEFRRNAELARALRRTLDAIDELRAQVPLPDLLERWRAGARVDPYALADLATFRGILGQLLKRGLRRALYSGDYHQIQRREAALATRIAALEATHHRTWSERADSAAASGAYGELERLALEVAAILDTELLEQLVGKREFKDLRAAVASESSSDGKGRRKPLAPALEALVPLLAGEDLKTFLALLLGSVLKRASLVEADRAAARPSAAEPAPAERPRRRAGGSPEATVAPWPTPVPTEAATTAPPSADETLPGIGEVLSPVGMSLQRAVKGARAAGAGASPVDAERRRETLERLHQQLVALQSSANPQWSSFRMLQRLLERHARIPPSIVQGAHPFVYEVLNGLVPQLEVAASFEAVPQEARRRLVECCLALTDDQLSPEQMIAEVPAHLARLHRLLEGLTAATAAQLRSLGAA